MPQVQHGDAVEFVLPGVDELALDVVVALRPLHAGFVSLGDLDFARSLCGNRAEWARGRHGGGSTALFGESVPFR